MKNKIRNIILIILSLTLVAGGLIYYNRRSLIAPFIPTVEQIGAIQIRINNDTSYVSVKLKVTNRLFLKIEIDTIRYKVALFNKTYLHNKKSLGLKMPAYGSDTVDFSLKIPYMAILKDVKAERAKGDSAGYSIDISLGYSTVFGASEIPIKKSAKLKIPEPPDLKIETIKWEKIRLSSIDAIVKIKIINYNAVTLEVKNINYSMRISKQGTLKGRYGKPLTIKPRGTTFIDLPIEIKVNNLGKTLFKILVNKDRYDYTFTLEASLESTTPLKESFHLNLVKSGQVELKK